MGPLQCCPRCGSNVNSFSNSIGNKHVADVECTSPGCGIRLVGPECNSIISAEEETSNLWNHLTYTGQKYAFINSRLKKIDIKMRSLLSKF